MEKPAVPPADHAKLARSDHAPRAPIVQAGKSLTASQRRIPYYRQTLDFTCGPAALMMAMKALDPKLPFNRKLELRIWRESTTVFMTSGHGGCSPYGLALSACHRGFEVEVYLSGRNALFVDSVRKPEKKQVIRLVQEDFLEEIHHAPAVKLRHARLSMNDLQQKFNQGAIPVVLISSYRLYKEKIPHWVVITGFDERSVYIHDPYLDAEASRPASGRINAPIAKEDFARLTRYGRSGQRAILIVKKPGGM